MDSFLEAFFNPSALLTSLPLLWSGFKMTVLLTIAIVPAAMAFGLALALIHDLGSSWARFLVLAYVDFLRSFPPLVLLIFLYSGLPFVGLRLNEFTTVVVALVANGAAFFGEIWRGGIASVPQGQRDAARSTGLGLAATMALVILPQAARKAAPALTNNVIELTKATTLAAVVALPELLRNARAAQDIVYNATPVMAAALIYLVILWPLVRILSRLELKMIAKAN